MPRHGFVRVAAAVPTLRVGDPAYNADRMLGLLERAAADGVEVVVFPEMGLTGFTCGDLFHQTALLRAASQELSRLAELAAAKFHGLAVVGLPVVVDDQVFNCAAVLHRGKVLGLVPKSYLPNYKEFYDARYFAAAATARSNCARLANGETVPFGVDLLFHAFAEPDVIVGIEICEDLWTPIPPSSHQALAGTNLLLNLSASNEVIGKAAYRRQLVAGQSGRCIAGYVYASCGVSESTTDIVFGGHCLIAENGAIAGRIRAIPARRAACRHRRGLGSSPCGPDPNDEHSHEAIRGSQVSFRKVAFSLDSVPADAPLTRFIDAHPFVPQQAETLRERCDEIFHTQVAGLAKRLEHIGTPPVTIGVSGGLDSTLALLVACKTFDALEVPARQNPGPDDAGLRHHRPDTGPMPAA